MRLANLELARACGLDRVTVRLDPLLPGVDDEPERLRRLLDEIARLGARTVVASYLFVTLRTDRKRLSATPYLGTAIERCTEAGPVQGTRVLSVPHQRKLELYGWMQAECEARGLGFATCGCKDLRLGGAGFPSRCGQLHHERPRGALGAPRCVYRRGMPDSSTRLSRTVHVPCA